MSRRRRSVDYEHVVVDVLCGRGHRVGMVIKYVGAHPRAGAYATGRGVRFEDGPDPSPSSGRVRGVCPECRDDVQVRWERIRDRLDRGESRGRHTDTIDPSSP